MQRRVVVGWSVGFLLAVAGGASTAGPQTVSPGSPLDAEARVESRCPTFSWSGVAKVDGYELVVYRLEARYDGAATAEPKVAARVRLPAGATSWTPTQEHCLAGPGHYAWVIGARVESAPTAWSEPALFRFVERPAIARGPASEGPSRAGLASGDPFPASSPAAGLAAWAPGSAVEAFSVSSGFVPPSCEESTPPFSDVPWDDASCPWIRQLLVDGVTGGCAAGKYCPDQPVTRRQLAMLLERAMRGTATWRPPQGGDVAVRPPAANSTWRIDGASTIARMSSITIGVDGLGVISYYDGTTYDLRVAHCENVACTESTSRAVDAAATAGQWSSITIGIDGNPLVSYRGDGGLKVAHCNDVRCGSAAITMLDASGGWVGETSIAIAGDGNALIAYVDAVNSRVKVAHCDDTACSSASLASPDNSVVDRGVSLVVGWDGRGILFFYDNAAAAAKAAPCADLTCSATLTPGVWDAIRNSTYLSAVIGPDGQPLVAYYDLGNGDLWVAHCGSPTCAPGNVKNRVDGVSANVGGYASITIGADGLGLISYYDATNGDLKVAHCGNADCSVATTQALDSTGSSGVYTSITLGVDGFGLVSHEDALNEDVRVVHCANVACAPFFRRR